MAVLTKLGTVLNAGGSGSCDHKVSVEEETTAGYLNEVLDVYAPLTKTVDGNQLKIAWDGTSNNTLNLISNMSLANATIQTNAVNGTTSIGSMYSMSLSCFTIPNYFNLDETDVFGIVTTNTVQDLSLFRIAIYKLDWDTNTLNIIAISKDLAPTINESSGYLEIEVETIYREKMDSYGIYYIGCMTDQTSVMVAAGTEATLFNTTKPMLGIKFHNIPNDTIIEKIDLSTGYINDTETTIGFQESTSRVCCLYRHLLSADETA